jgi:hypothetical protein
MSAGLLLTLGLLLAGGADGAPADPAATPPVAEVGSLDAMAEAPLRLRAGLRAQVEGTTGWSEETFLGAGGRLGLRLGSVLFSAAGAGVPRPSERREGCLGLFTVGLGLVRDVGAWEAEASLLLGPHAHRFADPYDAGPDTRGGRALGARLGVSRPLGFGPLRLPGATVLPLVSIAATAAWSGHAENRARGAETEGFVAFLSIGIGAALQGL